MNVSDEILNASIVEVADETGIDEIYDSDIVTALTAEWQSAVAVVTSNLNNIADYANGYALCDSVRMFANPPKLLSVPKVSDIVEDIFGRKGYAETIVALGIEVYIPPSFK